MFTGIIEALAIVKEKSDSSVILDRPAGFDDLKIGSSICVSGVCLSVIELDQDSIKFDVMPETLRKTKLGDIKVGDSVNLERALLASDRFEGHIVQGHIENKGEVIGITKDNEDVLLTISLPDDLISLVVPKGSISIDGVSLTVASVDGNLCTVALIPHTLKNSTLGELQVGDLVNVETDVIGKYVGTFLNRSVK